ncbi:MAG: hypothetical protein ACRCU6_12505 [Fusobacteriaceae bacterium]
MMIGVTDFKILDLVNFSKIVVAEEYKEFQREPMFLIELILGDSEGGKRYHPIIRNSSGSEEFIKKHGLEERYRKIKSNSLGGKNGK